MPATRAIAHVPPPIPGDMHEVSPKGALARERMLKVALDLFGKHGYDATTTRMVTQAAGMNLGSIPYYFGSKDDLYVEAANHLGAFIQSVHSQPLSALVTGAAATTEREALIELVLTFIDSQARILLSNDIPATWIQFFLRIQTEHGDAFEGLFTRVLNPVQTALNDVVARITGRGPDDIDTRLLSFHLIHQLINFRLAETVLDRRLPPQSHEERVETILKFIKPSLRNQLRAAALESGQ